MSAIAAATLFWAFAIQPAAGSPPAFDQVSIQVFVNQPDMFIDHVGVFVSEPEARPGQSLNLDNPEQVADAGSLVMVNIRMAKSPVHPFSVVLVLRAAHTLLPNAEASTHWDQAVYHETNQTIAPGGAFVSTKSGQEDFFSFDAYFAKPIAVATSGPYVKVEPPSLKPPVAPPSIPEAVLRSFSSRPDTLAPSNLTGDLYDPLVGSIDLTVSSPLAYRPLAPVFGSIPSTAEGEWHWQDITNGAFLAKDVAKQDEREHQLFLAGLLFGIAGAAAIAALLELLPAA